jgi:enterochelin esterase family protein
MTRETKVNGRVVVEHVESDVLRGNPAGDAHVRRVPVYLPPSYDEDASRRYPVVYVLSGFTGRGRMIVNDNPWSPGLDDRMDAMIAAGACPEMILVMPDAFTRFGGSQYLNSSATGRYADHLVNELVAWVDARYRTLAEARHRGIAGKSSGGFGALYHGFHHPDVFGAVACHSGDMYFEYCYRGDIPKFCAAISAAGGAQSWLAGFDARRQKRHEDLTVLNILAMAANYSPNPASPDLGIDLPCDPATGAFRPEVWERWLAFDPCRLVESRADALRSLRLLYLDCGTRDEFHLHLGARLFTKRLAELGIPFEYQEFDDGHMNTAYRYEVSLPRLARALGA